MSEGPPLPSDRERVRAVMRSDILYALAETLPEARLTGRVSSYPPFMGVAYAAFISIYRSARKVERELADPTIWKTIQDCLQERFPHEPGRWLPDTPMRRYHWDYFKRQHCVEETLLRLQDELLVQGARLCLAAGLMDPDGPGSFTNPHRDRMFIADGKQVTSLYKAKPGDYRVDEMTGEKIYLRADPDARSRIDFIEEEGRDPDEAPGEEKWIRGTKFTFLTARCDLGRIVLGVSHVPIKKGGEPATILTMMERLAPLLPGALALAYDRAWRGAHMQRLMTEMGLLSVAKVVRAPGEDGEEPKPREVRVESQWISIGKRRERVTIFAVDGAASVQVPNVAGIMVYKQLELIRVIRNQNKSGRYRFYGQYRLPVELSSKKIIVRLSGNEADAIAKFNRAEVLRAIPPSHDRFDHLYSRRSDIESLNRGLEDSLFINRAHSVGWKSQLLDMIGFALSVNTLTESRIKSRGQPLLAA